MNLIRRLIRWALAPELERLRSDSPDTPAAPVAPALPPPGAPLIRARYVDSQQPGEPELGPDDYTVQMEVSLYTVAAIFASNGWHIIRPGQGPQPSALEVAHVLTEMIATLDEVPEINTFHQYARFAAIRSDEFPDDIDLYLHIGTATKLGDHEGSPDITPEDLA